MSTGNARSEPDVIRTKITFLLGIYPTISPSMMQVGLGMQYKPKDWRPVLDDMVREGYVLKEEKQVDTPFNQCRTYTLLRLAEVGKNRLHLTN